LVYQTSVASFIKYILVRSFLATVIIISQVFKVSSTLGRMLSTKFSLTKWLSYSPMQYRRLSFTVVGDVEITEAPFLKLSYSQPLFFNGIKRNRMDMAIEAMAFFESKRQLNNHKLSSIDRDHGMIIAEMTLELMSCDNWINVPPLFPFSRYPGEAELPLVLPGIPNFFRAWDIKYFAKMLGLVSVTWLMSDVWKISADGSVLGLPWDYRDKKDLEGCVVIPSLMSLCAQTLSTYNKMFCGDSRGPFTVSTCANIYPDKIIHLTKKFDTKTRTAPNPSAELAQAMAKGLERMYSYMGTDKHFGKLIWEFNEADVVHMKFPQHSSAGIRAGGSSKYMDDQGIRRVTTVNGTKGDQEKAAKLRVLVMIQTFFRTGDIQLLEKACCICLKHEILNDDSINQEDRDSTFRKCREFFIPNIVQYIFASLVMKDRQMFERGRMIKIGLKWWHGGAFVLAEQLNAFTNDMVYSDGDFKGLDTTENRILLELYSSQALVYYDPNSPHFELFLHLLGIATENLSVKLVHLFARVWKIIIGVMPSGAFETSHGNSWIVGLLWWTYFEYVFAKYPERAVELEQAFQDKKIEFPVFGDDHILAILESLADILNEEDFASWVATNWNMKIYRIHVRDSLFSVPNDFGGLKVKGPAFLKRYFIKTPKEWGDALPPVLPYKRLEDILPKLAWGNSPRETYAAYAMSCIGIVYDTMGTNTTAYDICKEFFSFLCQQGGFRNMSELRIAFVQNVENAKDIQRMVRKAGITMDQLLRGFPSQEYLLSLHVLDRDYCDFSPPFGRYSASATTEWDKFREDIDVYD